MRIYEAAKKYNLTSDDLISILKKAKFPVKSHMSGMTDEMIAIVEKHLKAAPAPKAKSKAAKAKAPAAKAKTKTKTKTKVKAKPKAAKPATSSPGKGEPASRKVAPKTAPARRPERPTRGAEKPKAPTRRPVDARRRRRDTAATSDAQKKAVRESVRRTLAKIETTRKTKRHKRKPREAEPVALKPVVVAEDATVKELADALKIDAQEILKRCAEMGATPAVEDNLDKETIDLLAEDLGRPIQYAADEVEKLLHAEAKVEPSRLESRAPIVTVMGHVDHGKTSILDYIRKTRVASGEAGGITQHIGAYQVQTPHGLITFIDTPGHEAFTSMRARGAHVTDIVVLVVAADDGVMPQTVEAIAHANAAGVPIIVAVNKIDLPGATPANVKQQLMERNVVVEEFGGEVVSVDVSAKTGEGIDRLLEMISLQAELLELKADRGMSAQAVAIEVKKEEGRGILCTVLVTQGMLKVGDVFVVGSHYGKVRALLDDRGRTVKQAVPAMPVLVLGSNGLPEAGDRLQVVRGEKEAREASMKRQQTQKDRERRTSKKMTLEELYSQIQQGDVKELALIVKGDTNGSVEALTESLTKLTRDEVAVKVIHAGVGVVSESDVLLAASSDAVIIAFSVKVSPKAQELAEREKVEIKNYDIIYEVLTEVDDAMTGLLEPEQVERVLGRAEIRKVFKVPRVGLVAGSFVTEGSILRNAMARVFRSNEKIHEGRINSLKRFQDDVREVQTNFECGIGVSGFSDPQEGDVVEAFVVEEKARVG